MNIHIITSSFPEYSGDASGTAGLFVRQFAVELAELGHNVIVQPAARKQRYQSEPGLTIVPTPWKAGDQELASMNFKNPINWMIFIHFFIFGIKNTLKINEKYNIEKTLCMWAVPSGIFGLIGKTKQNIPYDVWVLGSDIWKIRKIPYLGRVLLRNVMKGAKRVYADGLQLCHDVKELTGVPCEFLATSRILPPPRKKILFPEKQEIRHFLFVGRYHINKGPDLLIRAITAIPEEIRQSIRVHMFGLGPMENDLKKLITDNRMEKFINLHGPIEAQELANYLDSVTYLVIPSRIESIPLIFSDALQIGTPVVAMPVGDLKSLIRQYNCGLVAEEVSAKSLADAITRASLLDKSVFLNNITNAYAQFDLTATVTKWLNFESRPADTGKVAS